MRRFLSNLFGGLRTSSTARGGRRAPRRATLRLEGLEDRLVLTSVSQVGPTAFINNMPQNHLITLQSTGFSNGFRGLEVFDNGHLVNNPSHFSIDSIKTVNIQVAGGDNVLINDSNGMPFAQNTTITLFGSGSNLLSLGGSRAISGNETYVAGGASFTPGSLFVDNLAFHFNSSIATVLDSFHITGTLDVQTSGTNVVLSGFNGATQTLSGMGFGGGDTLTYASKPVVELEDYAANAHILLGASAPELLEQFFQVNMHGAGDSTVIATTPSHVITDVFSTVAPVANQASVFLRASNGPVSVFGNSSTFLSVGQPLSNGEFSTHGIQSTVTASGVGDLFLSDSGNLNTPETVTVTQSTISGFGLFGNNGVTLFYSNVGQVNLVTGQDVGNYFVHGSHAGARFTSRISISYFSTELANTGFQVHVGLDSGSGLNLSLFNESKQLDVALFVSAPGASGVNDPGFPNKTGAADVFFKGGFTSHISYNGFTLVEGL
jgi:hypothetical protein